MAKMNKFSFAASAAAVLVFSAVAAAQDPSDAAVNLGATVTTNPAAACDNEACSAALQQCRADLATSTDTAKDALERFSRCSEELRKTVPVKPAKLSPPVCHAGGHLGTDCRCHENENGTGSVSSDLVPVRQVGNGAVVCVSSSSLYDQIAEMKRRVEALEGEVLALELDDTKNKVEALYSAIGDPAEFKRLWEEVLAWYQGAKDVPKRVDYLLRSNAEIMQAFSVLCPTNPDKPWESLEDRCKAAARAGRGTQVETRLAIEGVGGHRPGAGGYQGVQGRLELAYGIPGTQSALVMSGLAGYLGDQDTGPQYMTGVEGGYRYFFSKEKDTSADLLAYGQQYWSVHGAGYQGMPDPGMGWEVGGRARLAHCLTEAVCLGAEVGLGYTPRNNSFPGPYRMRADPGAAFNAGLGVQGRLPLY
jgi:hypothetical protein